jgi:anion-transporting  ArsA/GET3 family ATPase
MAETSEMTRLLDDKEIVVCVGSGGVGKTTTSAVIALNAALEGRKALVLTIDPARRLANSLGVSRLDNEPRQIPLERFREVGLEPTGELWAMMLDMKQSFDSLVNRHAPDAESIRSILRNRFYQYFSTSLAGTQEYAAAERLFEVYSDEDYDLIVLDTPPTTHALDFLEAPNRLIDAIDNRAMQWLYDKPSRLGSGLLSIGTNYVLRTLGKFTGGELLEELSNFLRAFSTLFGGFKVRAGRVRELLTSDICTFVVVTSPKAGAIDEAMFFHDKLGGERVRVGSFVVNRVHPDWVSERALEASTDDLAGQLGELTDELSELSEDERRDLSERLRDNARQFHVLAALDARSIQRLGERVPRDIPIVSVPYFSRDIHSLRGLDHVRTSLFRSVV